MQFWGQAINSSNFLKVSQKVFGTSWSLDFSRWQPSVISDMFGTHLDHPRRVHGGLYHYAKYGCNRCSSFENWNSEFFAHSVWKRLFALPKLVLFGGGWILPIKWTAISTIPQECTSLPEFSSFELSSTKIHHPACLVREFSKNEGTSFCYISPISPEAPCGRICTKFGI